MKQIRYILFLSFCFSVMGWSFLYGQMAGLHGDAKELRKNVHSGNQFRTTFYNDGTFGIRSGDPEDIAGEWPINSGHRYMIDGNVFVGSEVLDVQGNLKHIMSEVISCQISYSTGDSDPVTGEWWTFLPLPGFANPNQNRVAMSHMPDTWPYVWPDKWEDPVDPGWKGKWNGYFGKNILNADQESYFVADDYNNKEFLFYPDKLDSNRRGLGIRMYVRGFQWSNALVEDALFCLFDLENVGTHLHDKMVFGYKFGNNMGETVNGGDNGGDDARYNKDEDVSYMWDHDLKSDAADWGPEPVGYFGGVFLESPGNPYDGIDNDNDGASGSGVVITEAMFQPRILQEGDDIVVIDYKTFERTVTKMGSDTLRIQYQDIVYKFWPGKEIKEIPHNLVDDNLNGIIDENDSGEIGTPPNVITTYLYVGLKCIDYFTGNGKDNILIDERRDDGIDNDGDWNPLIDDVGMDGVAFTGDSGEGDGKPTSGRGTNLPGEPHIDKTDIDEADMIGLTSFTLYVWETCPHYDDEKVWNNLIPGYFDDLLQNDNVELLYGSGYFPLKPGQIERFSMGIICGKDEDDFLENKFWVSRAYNENYNFSKAPIVPKLTAVAGDGRVTLYWDDFAEQSYDPITGYDFEGYRIYRSTDPGWNDMTPITDGHGSVIYRKPLAQFDLKNGIKGYAETPLKGVRFWLGDDTGLRHSWVDTTVVNGYTYYYSVTSYDRGLAEAHIPPTECSKYVAITTSGEIEKGTNVAIVRPEAPSAGYMAPSTKDGIKLMPGSTTSGKLELKVIDPKKLLDGHLYHVTFEETLKVVANRADTLYTKSVSVIDVTDGRTVIDRYKMRGLDDQLPFAAGFELILHNEERLGPVVDTLDWNHPEVYRANVAQYYYRDEEEYPLSRDFDIVIYENVGVDTSKEFVRRGKTIPGKPVNFTVIDPYTKERLPFGFYEQDVVDGIFGAFTPPKKVSDEVVVLNKGKSGNYVASWVVKMISTSDVADRRGPAVGDTIRVRFTKPFLAHDVFEFEIKGEGVDVTLAKKDLDRIKVVPNPYVVTNSWEPLNPYSAGRGPRELHFIHLPAKCTIRIFNVRGQLVAQLEHNTPDIADGTEIWNMQTKDNLDISYGVYIYHVDAGELGEKVGKFAVIK